MVEMASQRLWHIVAVEKNLMLIHWLREIAICMISWKWANYFIVDWLREQYNFYYLVQNNTDKDNWKKYESIDFAQKIKIFFALLNNWLVLNRYVHKMNMTQYKCVCFANLLNYF